MNQSKAQSTKDKRAACSDVACEHGSRVGGECHLRGMSVIVRFG